MFNDCKSLTSIYYSGDIAGWFGINRLGTVIPSDYQTNLYIGNRKIECELVIPEGVTSIGEYAFSGCSGLTSVTIPNSVTTIERSAFNGCSGLTSVTISDSVTSIGEYAFSGCNGLTNVTIPEGVTSIGEYAFLGCSGLMSVTIPKSITSIGQWAFSKYDLPNLYYTKCYTVYYTGDITSWCKINGLAGIMWQASSLYIDGNKIESDLVIPKGVTSIGGYAFLGCSELTSITISDSVKSIGEFAFLFCSELTSVTIPDSVTSIEKSVFYGCKGLTEIRYNGTCEEWQNISKSNEWDNGIGNYTVYCTDGTVSKNGTVTKA